MRTRLLLLAALLGATLALTHPLQAHGGTYRGPGDTVPPGTGRGGGGAGPGGPGGAPTPGPSPPRPPGTGGAPTPTAPGGGVGGGSWTGSDALEPDLTAWDFWWGFNKDPYLNLKAHIHGDGVTTDGGAFWLGKGTRTQRREVLRPSEDDIRGQVVPALRAALKSERAGDIVTGAMVALAKIGDVTQVDGASQTAELIQGFLDDSSTEIAETAALSLGILGVESSVPTLFDLLRDTPAGRKLVGSTEVPLTSRAFAAFGLGVIGNRTGDADLRREIAQQLYDVLVSPSFATRDIKVAAMTAFGLTPLDLSVEGTGAAPARFDRDSATASRQAQLYFLADYFDEAKARENKDTRHWFVRAHAPTAMARLLAGTPLEGLRSHAAALFLEGCSQHSKLEQELQQSCVLALGQLGSAGSSALDVEIRTALERQILDGNQQARRYALIALGQVGARRGVEGDPDPWSGRDGVSKRLLRTLSKGKSRLQPWAALALGVFGRGLLEQDEFLDSGVSLALRSRTHREGSPADAGAFLLALGLRRDIEAEPILAEKLDYFAGSDEARGYAALALGLMEARAQTPVIQELVRSSQYRPDLLKQGAIALGLLGDKDLVPELVDMLQQAKALSSQAALASALGAIGDRRSIPPLIRMLQDDSLTQTARGFAAVALGIVCDRSLIPWNASLATNINYRANTLTLTGAGRGVLDIL